MVDIYEIQAAIEFMGNLSNYDAIDDFVFYRVTRYGYMWLRLQPKNWNLS